MENKIEVYCTGGKVGFVINNARRRTSTSYVHFTLSSLRRVQALQVAAYVATAKPKQTTTSKRRGKRA